MPEDHTTHNLITADDSMPAEDETSTRDDQGEEAQADNEAQDEEDGLSSCGCSYYPESLVDDEDAVQSFKQKILALGTQLRVNFEDIGYIRESDGIRAFPLTMRNPPEGATWTDGTRAVLRMNGDLALNDRRSRGAQIEDQNILSSDHPREANAATSGTLSHVYFFVQSFNGGNDNMSSLSEPQIGESQDVHEPQSPVSATSASSNNSNLSGSTLINGSPIRTDAEKIQFQGTGRLQADEDPDLTPGRLPLDMSVRADVHQELDTFGFLVNPDLPRVGRFGKSGPLYYSLYDAMFHAPDDLMVKAAAKFHCDHESFYRAYVAIKDILRDMDHLGWFSEADRAFSDSVINHGTIDDTQILIERTGDTSNPWRLSGIIGFDEAEIVPAVLNKRPWTWVWDNTEAAEVLTKQERFSWGGDVDDLPGNLPYRYLTPDDLQVMRRHEDVLIEKLYTPQYGDRAMEQYFEDTYGRGRWLRRLFGFARESVLWSADRHRFNKLVSDWESYRQSQNMQPRPLTMWNGLSDYIYGEEVEKPGLVKPPTSPSPSVESDPGAVASSSLQHVYFFVDPPASSPSNTQGVLEITDTGEGAISR